MNSPGTGKTRLLFEALMREWGFYIPCFGDDMQDPHGSHDLSDLIRLLEASDRNVPGIAFYFDPLDDTRPRHRLISEIRQSNDTIAGHLFTVMILSRVLILDVFLKTWNAYCTEEGLSDDDRRARGLRLWAHFQIHPTMGGNNDIIQAYTESLLLVDLADAKLCIRTTVTSWAQYSSWFKLKLVVIDEAEYASAKFPNAFPSSGNSEGRPVLRPIVATALELLKNGSIRVVVGGTKLGEELVRNALVTALGKFLPAAELKSFRELGAQLDRVRLIDSLVHFFGKTYIDKMPPDLKSDICFWLTGR